MAVDSTVGHGEPLAEFIDRAMAMPWCSKCGRPTLGMKEAAIEILRLRAELAVKEAELAVSVGLLSRLAEAYGCEDFTAAVDAALAAKE